MTPALEFFSDEKTQKGVTQSFHLYLSSRHYAKAAPHLYPEARGGNGSLNKFSPVDAEAPDFNRFPLFADAPGCVETVLGPDDTLFIPCGYWHYVRSLTPSFSLNFWF